MSFISLTFALFFLIFISLYHFAARFKKNPVLAQQILLLLASFVFYAFADLRFLPFLVYTIAVSYISGLFLCIGGGKYSKAILVLSIIAATAPLLFFKYSPADWHTNIIFPLGLSFFTFQSISYIADCYTKKIKSEKNLLNTALFISFFPVISSGPIQRAQNLIPQLKTIHHFDYDNATNGMKLFAWGMFKKLFVANRIAQYVDYAYANASETYATTLLLATILYSFQIYCDFSAYSDMAIGAARYMGFDTGKNFDHPYLSQSVGEFWKRWHISLSSWLRDYVYIPLGGSRVALPRIYANLLITFLVSGIWHGSTWSFVVWGLIHGLYQCIGRAAKPLLEKLKFPSFVKILVTFCLVTFAWIFFRAENLSTATTIIKKFIEIPQDIADFFTLKGSIGLKESIKTLFSLNAESCGFIPGMLKILAPLFIFAVASIITYKKEGLVLVKKLPLVVRWILYINLVWVLFAFLLDSGSSYSTNFIYQNF